MKRVAPLALLVLVPALLAVSCGGKSAPDGVKVSGAFGKQPTVTIPKTPPKGDLGITTLHGGSGAKVADGDLVVARDVGYRWSGTTNQMVANTFNTTQPVAFPWTGLLGGLKKALVGQKVGSRVLAVIPPSLGYGTSGYAAMQVAPTDSLVFVLDVLARFSKSSQASGAAQPQPDSRLPAVGTQVAGQAPPLVVPKSGPPPTLQARTLIKGTGAVVQDQQLVVFQDLGELWRNGKVIDSTWARGRPDAVVVGNRQMITGWDRAVIGQPVGSQILVVIPPKDGYGPQGHPASGIGAGDTLAFVIDILAAY
jgi:peptidylprolyl isomerase